MRKRFWARVRIFVSCLGPRDLEVIGACVVFAWVAVYLGRFLGFMGTTSLWWDELYSIGGFVSEGPWDCLTDYHAPNNHVFFNLLSSLLPGAGSRAPLRARVISFVAVVAALAVQSLFFLRRGKRLEAAALAVLVFANFEHDELALQARGYGLAGLCTVVCLAAAARYLEAPRTRLLWLFAAASLVGAWTLPTHVALTAPLFGVLWLETRRWHVLAIGGVAGLAILGAYAPIATQVLEHSAHYSEVWGEQFGTPEAVLTVVGSYLGLGERWQSLTAVFLGIGVPAVAWVGAGREGRVARLFAVVAAAGFGLCLLVATPLPRSVFFLAYPVAWGGVISLAHLYRRRVAAPWRPVPILGLAVLASLLLNARIRERWLPNEDWKGTAEAAGRLFGDDVHVYVTHAPYFLANNLLRPMPTDSDFSLDAFVEGLQIIADTAYRADPRLLPPDLPPDTLALTLRQRGGDYMQVVAARPRRDHPGAAQVVWPSLETDTGGFVVPLRVRGKVRIHVGVPAVRSQRYRSLFVNAPGCPELRAVARRKLDGATRGIRRDDIFRGDAVIAFALDDQPLDGIALEVHGDPGGACTLAPEDIWLVAAGAPGS